ncbi:hypothetical protein [Natrinema sp. 1APR25-10V2]|uniref:hypothetical protein n=1 Tax=Natrinema sp. 1APR25-10V2 TaxID=2951081 RepID=UPI0028755DB5|nr:hypothetical protein [Natrinema sp. 1APR25-10V2]MDS0474358.1 hypothetical protein [Natrinema sp. 1APR25-10V2]
MQPGDPFWTEKVEESDIAQDPLAMTRVTNRLLGDLLPGITTITPRARYIAHHTWAVWDTEQREDPETRAEFFEEIYRRERVLMLASVQHRQSSEDKPRNHTNIVGISTGTTVLDSDSDPIQLDFRFIRDRAGSYGQAYTGPMQTMGLTAADEGDPYRTVTKRGEELAEIYDDLMDSLDIREILTQDSISRETLRRIAPKLCLCSVCTPDAPDRSPLRDIYIPQTIDPEWPRDKFCAQSLQLLLNLADHVDDAAAFTSTAFVNAYYYGTVDTPDGLQAITVPSHLASQAARWQALRAHDYFGYAAEAVLESWLAFLDAQPQTDATIDQFKDHVTANAVYDQISTILDQDVTRDTSLETILTALWPDTDASVLTGDTPGTVPPMQHPRREHAFDSRLQQALETRAWEDVHAAWPGLILSIILRFAQATGETVEGWQWLRSHTETDLTPVRLYDDVRTHLAEDRTVAEFMTWFIQNYVIMRAEEVRQQKEHGTSTQFRGWFQRQDTGWEKIKDHTARHWSARFNSAVSILRDLALLNPDPDSDTVALTPTGRDVFERDHTETTDAP